MKQIPKEFSSPVALMEIVKQKVDYAVKRQRKCSQGKSTIVPKQVQKTDIAKQSSPISGSGKGIHHC